MTDEEKKRYALSALAGLYKEYHADQERGRRQAALSRNFFRNLQFRMYHFWRRVCGKRPGITVLTIDDPNRLRLGWVIYEECGFPVISDYMVGQASKEFSERKEAQG